MWLGKAYRAHRNLHADDVGAKHRDVTEEESVSIRI